jgi:hypothetical protein
MNDDAHEVEGEAIDAEILAATEADMLAGRETSERAEAAWARRTAFIGRRAAEILAHSREDWPVRVRGLTPSQTDWIEYVTSGMESFDISPAFEVGRTFVEGTPDELAYLAQLLEDVAGDIVDDHMLRSRSMAEQSGRVISDGFWEATERRSAASILKAARKIERAADRMLLTDPATIREY